MPYSSLTSWSLVASRRVDELASGRVGNVDLPVRLCLPITSVRVHLIQATRQDKTNSHPCTDAIDAINAIDAIDDIDAVDGMPRMP